MTFKRSTLLTVGAVALSACTAPTPDTRADFLSFLQPLCGNTYSGAVTSSDPEDADWREAALTLGPVECEDRTVRLPLAVGEDASRTWIVRESSSGLSLRHQHLHEDGSPDAVSMYGGFAQEGGTVTSQSFPADKWTRELFLSNDLPDSVANVWTMAIENGELVYRLDRPGREFRAAFPLTPVAPNPVSPPTPPGD